MMKESAYDKFMFEEILPSIKRALSREDRYFKKQMQKSSQMEFYKEDIKGIASYILTERTLQYIIFRELCTEYKVFPEDLAYYNSNERLDLSIFKNIKDPSKYAEIGIELKLVSFKNNGELYLKSLDNLISDFDKIKRAGNLNKYILLSGLFNKKEIHLESFNEYLYASIDNRKFRKFELSAIGQTSFKTDGYKENIYYLTLLLKIK